MQTEEDRRLMEIVIRVLDCVCHHASPGDWNNSQHGPVSWQQLLDGAEVSSRSWEWSVDVLADGMDEQVDAWAGASTWGETSLELESHWVRREGGHEGFMATIGHRPWKKPSVTQTLWHWEGSDPEGICPRRDGHRHWFREAMQILGGVQKGDVAERRAESGEEAEAGHPGAAQSSRGAESPDGQGRLGKILLQ